VLTALKSGVPTLTHAIPSGVDGGVYAVTSLDDEVFVVRRQSGRVEVYDVLTFKLQRHITVPQMGQRPSGMTACAIKECLYLSDCDNTSVHRMCRSECLYLSDCDNTSVHRMCRNECLYLSDCDNTSVHRMCRSKCLYLSDCDNTSIHRMCRNECLYLSDCDNTSVHRMCRSECLYLSDCDNTSIHRMEKSGRNAVKWSVAGGPRGLSVNIAHNLVVACCEANKLQEYKTHGSLVREICLQAGVTSPWHAIQLSTGDYVVSQWTSSGVVSVVAADGQVVRSNGKKCIWGDGLMKNPAGLAMTKKDDIPDADEHNNRSTGRVQELALSVDGGIGSPLGLCLDESRGRLYVGEFERKRRVLVFDGVTL